MPETPVSDATGVKAKTKAKVRYLRRKKARRSARKAAAPKTKDAPGSESPQEDEEEDVSDAQSMQDEDKGKETQEEVVDSHRKKKRKLSGKDEIGHEEHSIPQTENSSIPVDSKLPSQGSLPSFPEPSAPNAPSKSVLAMQGIDRALVHAEIVDPAAVLPISPLGVDEQTKLSERTRKRLLELGITELFAVQTSLLPFLISQSSGASSLYPTYSSPRDACVSAPTGSGKTLAYVLPIIEVLSSRIITRLRALVVLPTRDLVTQVRETFEAIGKGRGLKIGTVTGQHSFSHEQSQLVGESSTPLKGGTSKMDILICTPGRLMDHLNGTPNFTLQHLRFLVIDEADRLLAQSFHDWLAQVLVACDPRRHWGDNLPVSSPWNDSTLVPTYDSVSPALLQAYLGCRTDVGEVKESSCQKLLFSATLTRDPGKLASLGLRDPKYFIVQDQSEGQPAGSLDLTSERFTMPANLMEHMIICEPSVKPLMLLHLIHNRSIRNALVFTKSSESTSRLVRLIEFFQEASTECERVVLRAYSSDLSASERRNILEKFKAQDIHILVCSDLISRGLDISHVSHVVSYDAPVDIRKYVHRVGRTARAGRTGEAWTLVEEQEARYFKGMLREYSHLERIKRLKVTQKDTESLRPSYQIALQQLKEAYAR
ncbi:DEAD-domain-containing protein [Scleroderma citrinum]